MMKKSNTKETTPLLISAFLISAVLSGCAGHVNNAESGAIVGGMTGGVLGSLVSNRTGKIVAVAVGTLGGAMLGSAIGARMDAVDTALANQATQKAAGAPDGSLINWSNPRTGNYGTVSPTRSGTASSGEYCREFRHVATIGGEVQNIYGTACRNPDGSWTIVK